MDLIVRKLPDSNKLQAEVNSTNLLQCLEAIKKANIKFISLNSAYGWKIGTPIDFLKDNVWIEGVWIVDDCIDLTPINNLTNLEFFGLSGRKYSGTVDFINLHKIEDLTIFWDKKLFKNFESCKNLKELHFYNWPYNDLKSICQLSKLEKLELNFSKTLETLNGIEYLKQLNKLDFYSAPKLEDITDLPSIKNSLTKLSFWLCRNIRDYNPVGQLNNLETFVIQKSAPIHSVQMLKKLHKLWYVSIETEILDGDVSFLKEKNFKYKKMKKYEK